MPGKGEKNGPEKRKEEEELEPIREITERYKVEKEISRSEDTRVLLVRHKELGKLRVLKAVRRKCPGDKDLGRKEAEILSGLSHPSIPVLYDFFESEETCYLVEEYIRGTSLKDYLLRHRLTREEIASLIWELASVMTYLHKRPEPILYQDLKPEHVILQGDRLVLIDYGICESLREAGQGRAAYGTPAYASPEQLRGEARGTGTDLYSLGKLAEALLKKKTGRVSWQERRLLAQALNEDPARRPSLEDWALAWKKKEGRADEGDPSSLPERIAVLSNAQGTGTTHIAVSLTVWLNHTGRKAFYDDRGSGSLQAIRENDPAFAEKKGIIYHGSFLGLERNGPGIENDEPPKGIRVIDYGTVLPKADEADACLVVIGSSLWKPGWLSRDILRLPGLVLLVNPANRAAGRALVSVTKRQVFAFPLDPDPFQINLEKKKLFEKVEKEWDNEVI